MSHRSPFGRLILWIFCLAMLGTVAPRPSAGADKPSENRRLLYVAVPGLRNYLEYGGHGLLVFDIDDGHRCLRRIATAGLTPEGKPDNVKGICANAATKRIYISTIRKLGCYDLLTEKLVWERE